MTAGAGTWAGARIEDNIHNLNYVDPEENSTAQAREYLSQAQLVVSKRGKNNLQTYMMQLSLPVKEHTSHFKDIFGKRNT